MKRLLGLLGWLGVVLVLAAVALRFLKPELPVVYRNLALAGLGVTVLYALSQWRDIARSFQGRGVRYGSIAASSVLVLLAILVGINWISSRQNKRWDLTAAHQFELSDQTKQILSKLTKPLSIKVFYGNQVSADPFRDRLAELQYFSKQITVEYIDADKDPLQAKASGIDQYGTILFGYDGRTEKTTSSEESDIANALKKLVEGKAKKVYLVQGHGEHDVTGTDQNTSYSAIQTALQGDNFEVAKLTLAQQSKVPDDATMVIVAGPKTDYLQTEMDALRGFLRRGGKLFMLLDPPDKADAPPLTNLIALAKEWGIDVGNDLILDPVGQQMAGSAGAPVAMPLQHPITDKFGYLTAFPLARSVTPVQGGTNGKLAQKILETSPQSWAETDLKPLLSPPAGQSAKPTRDLDKGDKPGPVSIAAATSAAAPDAPPPATADAPKQESRVVVVGDSDFISNRAINFSGNKDLFLNMANWLAQQENLIAIRSKDPEDRRLTMTQDQSDRMFYITVVIIPALLFLNGVWVWWKRR